MDNSTITLSQISRALSLNLLLDTTFAHGNPTLQLHLYRQRRWLEAKRREVINDNILSLTATDSEAGRVVT